jgi:hypothetical protein
MELRRGRARESATRTGMFLFQKRHVYYAAAFDWIGESDQNFLTAALFREVQVECRA